MLQGVRSGRVAEGECGLMKTTLSGVQIARLHRGVNVLLLGVYSTDNTLFCCTLQGS